MAESESEPLRFAVAVAEDLGCRVVQSTAMLRLLPQLLDAIRDDGQRFVLSRGGRWTAVLVPLSDLITLWQSRDASDNAPNEPRRLGAAVEHNYADAHDADLADLRMEIAELERCLANQRATIERTQRGGVITGHAMARGGGSDPTAHAIGPDAGR